MADLLNNRVALRWATGISFGLVVATITSMHHWQFYALLFLIWLMYRETWRLGVEEGVCLGVSMNTNDRRRLKKLLNIEDTEQEEE